MQLWECFFAAATTDLDELTDTVTSYISFCEDVCVPTETFCTCNNNKLWFTEKLRQLCHIEEEVYRTGDRILYS